MNEPPLTDPEPGSKIHDGRDDPAESASDPIDHVVDDELDLDAIERELDGVEAALQRLDDGTYWTDEVTGEPIPDAALLTNPTARREH